MCSVPIDVRPAVRAWSARHLGALTLAASLVGGVAAPALASPPEPPRPGEPPAVADGAPADGAPADGVRFAEAVEAVKRGEPAEALRIYRELFANHRSFAVAANLGALELAAGQPEAAATHLAYALRHFPIDGSPELRRQLTERLERAKSDVAEVTVETNVPSFLSVDGQPAGLSPLADPLYVAAGTRVFEAKRGAYSAAQTRAVNPGEAVPISLSLPAAAASEPLSGRAPSVGAGYLAAVVTGTALAVGGIGAGVGLLFAARSRDADARERGDALTATGSADPCTAYAAVCDEIARNQNARDQLTLAGAVSLGAGGAFAVGTVLYAILADSSPDDAAQEDAAPSVAFAFGPGGAQLGVVGRW